MTSNSEQASQEQILSDHIQVNICSRKLKIDFILNCPFVYVFDVDLKPFMNICVRQHSACCLYSLSSRLAELVLFLFFFYIG